MNSGMNSTKVANVRDTIPKSNERSLIAMWNTIAAEAENVEELHFLMVKLNQSIRNSVEKIERKHSVLLLDEESTLKKF